MWLASRDTVGIPRKAQPGTTSKLHAQKLFGRSCSDHSLEMEAISRSTTIPNRDLIRSLRASAGQVNGLAAFCVLDKYV